MRSKTRWGPLFHRAHPRRVKRVEGVGLFDGVILAGWRTGARVQVEPGSGIPRFRGAHLPGRRRTPRPETCFKGIIHVGRAPRD